MKATILALFSALLFPLLATAQDYAFKVLVNKGKNEIRSGTGWEQIKVGASLTSNDELRIAENAYLGLMHITGKPLEVKKAGDYKVVDLAGRIKGGTSVLNKYTDFILSEEGQKRGNLVATGAVHRGINQIEIYLPKPESALVYGNSVIINWNTDKIAGPYIVTLSSMFGDELARIETSDSTAQVDLYDKAFKNEDNILVEVMAKADPSTRTNPALALKKLSKADRDRIKTALGEIEGALSEKTALDKLILAGFFEKNNLMVDATHAWLEAIRMAPDVAGYRDRYELFLLRNNIKAADK